MINNNINFKINKSNIQKRKITLYPDLDENIQLIIIGHSIKGNLKELSFLDIYENINNLKKYKNNNKKDNLINFDILMTKNEFTTINGSFLKNSNQLMTIPIINAIKFMTLNEYIHIFESNNNATFRI